MKFYIGTGIERRDEMLALKARLEERGHQCTYDWGAHGSVQDEGDARYLEVAMNEANGVSASELTIILLPGGRGTHTELGLAVGLGKDVITVGSTKDHLGRDCVFYWHPKVIKRLETVGELLAYLDGAYTHAIWRYA